MDKASAIQWLSHSIRDLSKEDEGWLKENFNNGLNVYRRNYLMGLIGALKRKYPCVEKVLGENNFNFFSKKFIAQHPSRSPNIDDFGTEFFSFLKKQRELKELQYLGDLAAIDRLWFDLPRTLNTTIKLPKGTLKLWNNLHQGQVEKTEIDENIKEELRVSLREGEYIFVAKPLEEIKKA